MKKLVTFHKDMFEMHNMCRNYASKVKNKIFRVESVKNYYGCDAFVQQHRNYIILHKILKIKQNQLKIW